MTDYFQLKCSSPGNWGDYGNILVHGIAKRVDSIVQLQRTGPFVPIISNPFRELILQQPAVDALNSARVVGVTFTKVTLTKIVRSNWHLWNYDSDPELYPENGEPEGYIFDWPDNRDLALNMPDLYAVEIPRSNQYQHPASTNLVTQNIPESDIFGANAIWLSKKAVETLEPFKEQYVNFERVSHF